MLVACRLAGLSVLGAHYAGVKGSARPGGRNMPLRQPGGISGQLRRASRQGGAGRHEWFCRCSWLEGPEMASSGGARRLCCTGSFGPAGGR